MGSEKWMVETIMRLLNTGIDKEQRPSLHAYIEGEVEAVVKDWVEAGETSLLRIFAHVIERMQEVWAQLLADCKAYALFGAKGEYAKTSAEGSIRQAAGVRLDAMGIKAHDAIQQGRVVLGQSSESAYFAMDQWIPDSLMEYLNILENGFAPDSVVVVKPRVPDIEIDLPYYSAAFREKIDQQLPTWMLL